MCAQMNCGNFGINVTDKLMKQTDRQTMLCVTSVAIAPSNTAYTAGSAG